MTALLIFIMTVLIIAGIIILYIGVTTDTWWQVSLSLLLFATAIIIDVTFADTISPNTTEEIYPRTMVVSEIDAESDIVTLTDSTGHMWEFYGVEDWEVGDICSCIMDTNGTENITDDIIVDARYNGRMEDLII